MTTFVVNLTGLVPPPRYDGVAWTEAILQEAPGGDGPWTQIDTQTRAADVDPTQPAVQNLTSTRAQNPADWFRVIWQDPAGNQAQSAPRYLAPASAAAGTIASVGELKQYLGGVSKNTSDQLLELILRSVSDRVEAYCGRAFRPNPPLDDFGNDTLPPVVTTVYPMRHTGAWFPTIYTLMVQIPPTREITDITLEGWEMTDYNLVGDPPWTSMQVFDLIYRYYAPSYLQLSTLGPTMLITGRFGWYPPPEDLKDAVLVMAARRYRERDAQYGDAIQMPEGGIVSYFRQFPPSVQATLDQYRDAAV